MGLPEVAQNIVEFRSRQVNRMTVIAAKLAGVSEENVIRESDGVWVKLKDGENLIGTNGVVSLWLNKHFEETITLTLSSGDVDKPQDYPESIVSFEIKNKQAKLMGYYKNETHASPRVPTATYVTESEGLREMPFAELERAVKTFGFISAIVAEASLR